MTKTVDLNTEAAEQVLSSLAAQLSDMSPIMKIVSEELLRMNRDRARRGVKPDGTPFAPRSALTLQRYLDEGKRFGATPLTKSGRMLRSMSSDSGRDFASVGVTAIQAAVMQFGAKQGAFGRSSRNGPIPWGTIPARPMIGMGPNDLPIIVSAIEAYLSRVSGDQ